MRRVLSIIVHNWPLKVAAVVLASLLYAGLVLAQNSKEWRDPGPHRRPQPAGLGGAHRRRPVRDEHPLLRLPTSPAGSRATTFNAWIDLASTTPDSSNDIVVKVNVSSPDPQVQVLDWTPRQIAVRLDPLSSKTVPVQVDSGTKPPGLDVHDPDRGHDTR